MKTVLFVALAALTSPPTAASRARPICYRLHVESGSSTFGPRDHLHGLPPIVRLDTMPAGHGGWRLQPNIAFTPPAAFPGTPAWTVVGDSIELVWSNGDAVTTLRLGGERNGVRFGTATARNDVVVPDSTRPRARVRAIAVACPRS
ncbi:MAG TPA: hypothetical protein VN651_10195 [Gemmatimonadaceae bacterium]|nr:hypothetical protein [Gemmatimonadaceae bacterium]